jgi:hypothetical protein
MAKMPNVSVLPSSIMDECLKASGASSEAMESIFRCAKDGSVDSLQRMDENITRRILSKAKPKPFIPFMVVNGEGDQNWQASQIVLAERIRHWKSTLGTGAKVPLLTFSHCKY